MQNKLKFLENRDERMAAGRKSLLAFTMGYFPHFLTHKFAPFHKDWNKLFKFEVNDFLALIGFRDSAKTAFAKINFIRHICYKLSHYMIYGAQDKEAAGGALFDIAVHLQVNKKLIADFGQLFYSDDNTMRSAEKKSINNFVTGNGVRVQAVSVRESTRGFIHDSLRPDYFTLDDFENNVTKKSAVLTRKTIEFIKELIAGLPAHAKGVFLCNKISDTGSVQWVIDTAEKDKRFFVSEVPVMIGGEITWKSKYVATDEEAMEKNEKIVNPLKKVKSLQTIKRRLNSDGKATYEQEMMNEPLVDGERFFDIKIIDKRIAVLKARKWQRIAPLKNFYRKTAGDWIWFGGYNKEHRYGIGADVSEGVGIDSSVIEIIDFDDGKQIAEYESCYCDPELLGMMMAEQGRNFGRCILAPERNSIGNTTVRAIKNAGYRNMFREKTMDKISDKPVQKFGWHTNSKTKPHMLFEFRRDFEAGLIEINSLPLLREMRSYTNSEVTKLNFDPDASNHFDRVIAFAITWQMRGKRVITSVS